MANIESNEFVRNSIAAMKAKAGHGNQSVFGPLGNQGPFQNARAYTTFEVELMERMARMEAAVARWEATAGFLQHSLMVMQMNYMRFPQVGQAQFVHPQFGFHPEPIQEQPALAARVPLQGPIQVPQPTLSPAPQEVKQEVNFLKNTGARWADVHDQNTEEFDRKTAEAKIEKVENAVVAKPKSDPARGRHKPSKEEKKEFSKEKKEKFRLSPEAAAAKKEQLRMRREEEGIKAAQNSYENLVGMSELEIESKSCDAQRVRELLIEYFKPCKGVVDEDMCAARFNTLINEILLRKQMEQVQAPTGNRLVDEANLNSKMNKIMHELDFWGQTLEGKKFYSNIIYQGPPEYIQIPIHGEETAESK